MVGLNAEELRSLSDVRAPYSVSLYLPTERMGRETRQGPIRLKNLLREAEERLVANDLRPSDARLLLEPVEALRADEPFWQFQSDGLALFLSSGFYRQYRVPINFDELVVVADRFHLKPLLPLITNDGLFYVLALSQNQVRLYQNTRHSTSEIDLGDTPRSLAEALQYDDPEKQLQFHTGTQPSPYGQRSAIFHGHGGGANEDNKENILRYLRQVDEGVREAVPGDSVPLVLAGVEYLLPIYSEATSYPRLMSDGVTGNPDELSAEELRQRAWPIVERRYQTQMADDAARYAELTNKGRASSDLEEVVAAAIGGRVEALFVAVGVQRWGTVDREQATVQVHPEAQPGDEDLLDLAAIQTFLNSGLVYVVEPGKAPGNGKADLAAVFRY